MSEGRFDTAEVDDRRNATSLAALEGERERERGRAGEREGGGGGGGASAMQGPLEIYV